MCIRDSATNGLGSGDATINLQIDRDKVRSYGLTVAQVYQQIAAKLTTTTTAQTPVAIDGSTMNVQISNNLDPMTKENMMDMTFTTVSYTHLDVYKRQLQRKLPASLNQKLKHYIKEYHK